MSIDLNSMDRKELEKLRKDVDKAIDSLADRERKAAIAAAEKAAQQHGFSLSELTGGAATKSRRTGSKGIAKYRNPADPKQTWTGKGRRPRWIVEAEAAGRPLADFEI